MKAKDSMILLAITSLLLISSLARAEANNSASAASNEPVCVEREVTMVVKTGNGVHYSEADEGQVISRIKIKDCGSTVLVDNTTASESQPVRLINPDLRNVEDDVRP